MYTEYTSVQFRSTCLEAAMFHGHYAVVELLLWNGADISRADSDVSTATGDVNLAPEHELAQEEVVTAVIPFILLICGWMNQCCSFVHYP